MIQSITVDGSPITVDQSPTTPLMSNGILSGAHNIIMNQPQFADNSRMTIDEISVRSPGGSTGECPLVATSWLPG